MCKTEESCKVPALDKYLTDAELNAIENRFSEHVAFFKSTGWDGKDLSGFSDSGLIWANDCPRLFNEIRFLRKKYGYYKATDGCKKSGDGQGDNNSFPLVSRRPFPPPDFYKGVLIIKLVGTVSYPKKILNRLASHPVWIFVAHLFSSKAKAINTARG
jgi:hypothetical protein